MEPTGPLVRGLRRMQRGGRVAAALAVSAARLCLPRSRRREVLHRLCRHLTRILRIEVTLIGEIPAGGVIVSNHLGYVDILVLASIAPVAFVAKREVATWPVFGWFARRTGSVFVDRGRRADALRVSQAIAEAVRAEGPVVLFPEGTSSGGHGVLPFHSSLLGPAAAGATAAALAYRLDPGEGNPAEAVCYWKDHVLGVHLLGLLGLRRVKATVRFGESIRTAGDRKALAERLHREVKAMVASAGEDATEENLVRVQGSGSALQLGLI